MQYVFLNLEIIKGLKQDIVIEYLMLVLSIFRTLTCQGTTTSLSCFILLYNVSRYIHATIGEYKLNKYLHLYGIESSDAFVIPQGISFSRSRRH